MLPTLPGSTFLSHLSASVIFYVAAGFSSKILYHGVLNQSFSKVQFNALPSNESISYPQLANKKIMNGS